MKVYCPSHICRGIQLYFGSLSAQGFQEINDCSHLFVAQSEDTSAVEFIVSVQFVTDHLCITFWAFGLSRSARTWAAIVHILIEVGRHLTEASNPDDKVAGVELATEFRRFELDNRSLVEISLELIHEFVDQQK